MDFKTMKDLTHNGTWMLSEDELRNEASRIIKAIEESGGILEIDGYIFTKESVQLLKWFLNIEGL